MKRISFEEFLGKEFRWPTAGGVPFVEKPDPWENANIADSARARLFLMTEGYRKGADLMVARALRMGKTVIFLVAQ
jgi:hypothetical protein